ncbi:DNA-directed DNA polymerase, partial [Bertholletia excelsa]
NHPNQQKRQSGSRNIRWINVTSTNLNINKSEINEFQRLHYCDIQQKISESKDLAGTITVIVFDIETTGFSRENERIIEIAMQDLLGGENSTFQTLVNPERYVPNSHIHGISTPMVNRTDVPRMKDLIPILLQYVKSRQKPGGHVLWIAHNARCFDVPFLFNEFSRCFFEVPPDWLFMDTLPLAREVMKSEGLKPSSKVSLQALREHYGIPLIGSAHRAMSDVKTLSLILQRMTFDLKLPVSDLVARSFRPSDLANAKKKKNSS